MNTPAFHISPPPNIIIVESTFYAKIAEILSQGATDALHQASITSIERLQVPGAFEIPAAIAMRLNASNRARTADGFIALGCVIRGETSHYDIVANESARGLMNLSLQGIAIGNGILTVDTKTQAFTRAKERDKGGDAARACLQMLQLKTHLHA